MPYTIMGCVWLFFFILLLRGEDIFSTGSESWPKQTYGLLKPTTGCPDGWQDKGSLYQDTVDTNPSNNKSETLHIDGYVSLSYVITSFCIKTAAGNTEDPAAWPLGKYCVYRKRGTSSLPPMTKGDIRMTNKLPNLDKGIYYNNNNKIYYKQVQDGHFRNLWLYFFCHTRGNKNIPISLPITKPFYLLPYGSRDCQQVKWMVATSEWIKYHTNNDNTKTGQTSGAVPHHEFGENNNKGITMYYCYYESCKHTLNDTKGVFQSPGFPGEYPDGQLCSWSITVPENHIIHVRFTNFSLDENDMKDNLTFFKNSSLNDTLHGRREPFTITATSDVVFEFLTNEEGNSTGFRAEYTVFKTSEMTPSPPSLPSTNRKTDQHTTPNTNTGVQHTTIPATETKNKTNNNTADTFKKSRVSECDGTNTAKLIVIPLICLIVVIAVVIVILYRWRSKNTKCEKCASSRYPKEDVTNPTYDDAGHIPIQQRTSTATMNTTVGTDDNDGQMYQALSHDQQPEYEAPDYSKQNGIDDPNMDSGYPEYHELEPMDNNVPDVMYDVLEGPDSNDGPSDDQMYQALDKETTHNPLYQSTQPAAMVTRNPMYVDSVA